MDENGSIRPSRAQLLKLELSGGTQSERSAIKEAFAGFDELQVEVVETDSVEPSAPTSGEVALVVAILDPGDQSNWRSILRPRETKNSPAFVVALLADPGPDLVRAALRAGADDVLPLPPSRAEAIRVLLRTSERARSGEKHQENIVCSLASVGSGGGLPHLAVNLGSAIRRLFEKRVVLVDLDLQAAPLGVLLDIEPEHTIGELADPTSAVDSMRLESVLCKHESGLYLLGGPKRIEEAELISAASIEAATRVLREIFDVTIIDCGTYINESSVVAWEQSDWLLYVIEQSITGIRAAQRFLSLFHRLNLRDLQPTLVLNRYDPNHPITREQIAAALQLPIFATIPRDDYAFTEMQITGKPAGKIHSGSLVKTSFETLARKILAAGDPIPESRPGLITRMLNGFGL